MEGVLSLRSKTKGSSNTSVPFNRLVAAQRNLFFFFLAFVRQCQLKCPQSWAQRQQWQPIHFPDELSPAGEEVTSPKVIYGIVDLSFLHLQLFATHKHTHPPSHTTPHCTPSCIRLPFLYIHALLLLTPRLLWFVHILMNAMHLSGIRKWTESDVTAISSLKFDVIGIMWTSWEVWNLFLKSKSSRSFFLICGCF